MEEYYVLKQKLCLGSLGMYSKVRKVCFNGVDVMKCIFARDYALRYAALCSWQNTVCRRTV